MFWWFQLDFTRIICCHEHYVALSLPLTNPSTSEFGSDLYSGASSPTPSIRSTDSQSSFISHLVNKSFYIFELLWKVKIRIEQVSFLFVFSNFLLLLTDGENSLGRVDSRLPAETLLGWNRAHTPVERIWKPVSQSSKNSMYMQIFSIKVNLQFKIFFKNIVCSPLLY